MSILQFLVACDTLKRIPRTGWLLRGVAPSVAEDVAGHSHTTALVAYILALLSGETMNISRLLLMALIHDVPEARLGDIPRSSTNNIETLHEAKRAAEEQVMKALVRELPLQVRTPLTEAWQDLCGGTSREAQFVEAADRLATALHAFQLIQAGYSKERFKSFIIHAEKTVTALKIPAAEDILEQMRRAFSP